MDTRSVLIAISLCGAWACDAKVEPVGTSPTTLPRPFRVYVTTTLIQPLEQVSVSIEGANAANATWTSSDESVATISRGILTGVSPGAATISASVGGLTGNTVVHVGWRPELIESSSHWQLDGRDVAWTTSNLSIVRVDASAALTTFAAGTTTLVGRFRGLVDSAVVEVGGLFLGFGYFHAGDALITDADYYGDTFWTPAPGKSFSTAGSVSATWEPPYASKPDLGWVGPTPLASARAHASRRSTGFPPCS